ncbi:MAG: type IX secretion system protein PorQ [Rhodothermales bacterium]
MAYLRQFRRLTGVALVTASLALAALPAAAQSQQSGFSFLRIEPSARAAALGGSYAAVYGDDINGMFYNPALLNEGVDRQLSVSFLNHVGDVRAGMAAYGFELGGLGQAGVGVRFLGWGDLTERDAAGEDLGSFRASDLALTVGLAHRYDEHLLVGVNLHSMFSRVAAYNASALAADIGVLYHSLDGAFTASASVNNLGITLNALGSVDDELPLDLRVAFTRRLRYLPLLLSVTAYDLHDVDTAADEASTFGQVMNHVALGGEFQFSEGFNLRVGYNHRRHEALKIKSRLDFAGFGFGAGIKVSRLRFDYAYSSWSSFGGMHLLTLRTVI